MVDFATVLALALPPIGAFVFDYFLMRSRRAWARRDELSGELVLEHGRALRLLPWVVIASMFALLLFIVVGLGEVPTTLSEVTIVVATWSSLVGLSLVLAVEAYGVAIAIAPDGIRKRTPWTPDLFIRWGEVESITFNPSMSWFVVKAPQGRIRVHVYLSGLEDFRRAVRENVPPDRWARVRSRI